MNMEAHNNIETPDVQQSMGLAGPVVSQVQALKDLVDEAVNQPTDDEQKRQQRLELLRGLRLTTKSAVEEEVYSLSVDGVGIFALRDIHGVKSKQKQGKTSVLKVCLSALMAGSQFRLRCELPEPRVLWLDTEQKQSDVKLIIGDVKQMTGIGDDYLDSHLFLYTLRRMSYDTLLGDLQLLVADAQPQVVFVDGIVEFVASFNDEVLSRQLIHDLLVLCDEHNCAIVCVLHENKAADDQNMRGHLGTVLSQKAGTVLKCNKSQRGIITASSADARHGDMPEWSIAYDAEGHLCDADEQRRQEDQQRRSSIREQRRQEELQKQRHRLQTVLAIIRDNGGTIGRKQLTSELVRQLSLARSTVANFLTAHLGSELVEDGGMISATDSAAAPF